MPLAVPHVFWGSELTTTLPPKAAGLATPTYHFSCAALHVLKKKKKYVGDEERRRSRGRPMAPAQGPRVRSDFGAELRLPQQPLTITQVPSSGVTHQ